VALTGFDATPTFTPLVSGRVGLIVQGTRDVAPGRIPVNFTAVDPDGAAKTIGWEAINAVVTDVEYDFSDQTTTLTFSNDQAELIGLDTEQVKQRLKIAAAEVRRTESFMYMTTTVRSQRIGEVKRTQFSQMNSVWETSMRLVGGDTYFVNSVTGEVE
jgi:hypothetical protein